MVSGSRPEPMQVGSNHSFAYYDDHTGRPPQEWELLAPLGAGADQAGLRTRVPLETEADAD